MLITGTRVDHPGRRRSSYPPMYVKAYVKRGKSDAIDAEVICDLVPRPNMRFIAIKTVEQQCLLPLHRAHDPLVSQKTRLSIGLRRVVAEFGVYIPRGLARVVGCVEDITFGEVLYLAKLPLARRTDPPRGEKVARLLEGATV